MLFVTNVSERWCNVSLKKTFGSKRPYFRSKHTAITLYNSIVLYCTISVVWPFYVRASWVFVCERNENKPFIIYIGIVVVYQKHEINTKKRKPFRGRSYGTVSCEQETAFFYVHNGKKKKIVSKKTTPFIANSENRYERNISD